MTSLGKLKWDNTPQHCNSRMITKIKWTTLLFALNLSRFSIGLNMMEASRYLNSSTSVFMKSYFVL
jgi:hypothetical protein